MRDAAMIRFFLDTGCRLGEVVGLDVADVYLKQRTASVIGKGRKHRWVAFGSTTAGAIGDYLSERSIHRCADEPKMWLGIRGGVTESGVYQFVRRRGAMASIDDLHPHRFRHTFAHRWLAAGGSETDLLTLAGWTSPEMLNRYGASARSERALEAYRRLRLDDLWTPDAEVTSQAV